MVHVAGVAIELVTNVSRFSVCAIMFVAHWTEFEVVTNACLVSLVTFHILVNTRTIGARDFDSWFKWALAKLHLAAIETFGLIIRKYNI
jgi:hypothetical protein